LGITQTKRQAVMDITVAANAHGTFTINTAEDPCNIHGLIVDLHAGITGAGLTFGQWALVLLPRGTGPLPIIDTTAINAEADNPVFWMLGNYMMVAESVDHFGGAPKTSRNCPRGGRLIIRVSNSALSGSTIRVHGTITWFETIK